MELLPLYFFVILIGSQFNTVDKKFRNVFPVMRNENDSYETIERKEGRKKERKKEKEDEMAPSVQTFSNDNK